MFLKIANKYNHTLIKKAASQMLIFALMIL